MSNLVHVANSLECPEVKFHSNRDAHDPREATDYLWTMLDDFGCQHCIHRCIGCLEQMDKADKKRSLEKPLDNYETAFKVLHDALGQLPENLYAHLLDITNGDCPGCAIQTALMQFPIIAHYSENAPVGWDALPCYFEEDMDDWGTRFSDTIHHITALLNLNLNKLPPRMPPAERRDAKAKIAPGKSIVEFVRNFLNGRVQLSATLTDDDLWTLLKWHPTEDSLQFSGTPSRQWKSWAKRELTSAKEGGSPLFLSRVLRVVLNCYKYASYSYIDGYSDIYGLEHSIFSMLYQECEYLSNVGDTRKASYGYPPFNVALENADGNLLTGHRDNGKTHYKLTFIGEKECQRHGGIPPSFFQHGIENEPESRSQDAPPPVIVTSTDIVDTDVTANSNAQSVAKSNATATGIGMGGAGGNGGNAAVTFEREAMKLVANPTISVAGQGDVVRETRETVFQTLDWVEEKFGVPLGISRGGDGKPGDTGGRKSDNGDSEKVDAAIWSEWEQAKAAKIPKAKFAKDKSMTENEVQNALDRHRKRLGR